MDGFLLLTAHLVADFLTQEDWQAKHKTNPHPGPVSGIYFLPDGSPAQSADAAQQYVLWHGRLRLWWVGHLACTLHCLLYTATVAAFSFWWMPWWGYPAVFVSHWVIDRFRLARVWMERVSHQKQFATGPLSPWSVIVVDQVFHLLALAVIVLVAKFSSPS